MNEIAAPHASANSRHRWVLVAVLVAAATLLTVLGASLQPRSAMAAKPVAKDGKIYACYKVRGKPKGSMRMLLGTRHCKRGERRVAWIAAPSAGQPGPSSNPGAKGDRGARAEPGPEGDNDLAGLEASVGDLNVKIAALEGALSKISTGDLAGVLAKLEGISHTDLLGAIAAPAQLATVCGQVSGLVDQVNLLRNGLTGPLQTLTGTLLGPIFGSVEVPAALQPFCCPEP
jgi:hypothetical protein